MTTMERDAARRAILECARELCAAGFAAPAEGMKRRVLAHLMPEDDCDDVKLGASPPTVDDTPTIRGRTT